MSSPRNFIAKRCGHAVTRPDADLCRACLWKRDPGKPRACGPAATFDTEDEGPPPSTLFDERWDLFCRWIGRSKASKAPKRAPKRGNQTNIFHTTDWHCPHLHEAAFMWALRRNLDADIAVVGGDIFNAAAASRFIEPRFEHPRDELAQALQFVQILAETFPKVILRRGNHDDRIRKYFGTRIPPYMMFLVRSNIVEFLAQGLRTEHGTKNIEVAGPMIDSLPGSDWFTQIGDCVFSHAQAHSKVKMRPAENAARWLHKWSDRLSTPPAVVVQEHNHKSGMAFDAELGVTLIQAPCLSFDHAYQVQDDIKYEPNQLGYVRIVQENGRTLLNESRYFLYGGELEEKVA